MTEQAREDEEATALQPNPFNWVHSIPDQCSSLVVGPWTALVGDPVETPPAIRIVGRYVARGFLRHVSGKSLGRDFPGNTAEEALNIARKWVEGSIQMWLRAIDSMALSALSAPPSVISYLPPILLEKIGAVNPRARIAPQPPAEILEQMSDRRKGRRRRRRRR